MLIKSAKFIKSSASYRECPKSNFPEFAFIGRSNVGKSSLINMLTNQKKLAKTSNTPGKTQLINHFIINNEWYLVDLPGYGYAKVSKSARSAWEKMIRDYLYRRDNLACVVVLIDIRHDPQQIDLEFIESLGRMEVPLAIVFTKADKVSSLVAEKNKLLFEKEMLKNWESLPDRFVSSSKSAKGKEEILSFINQIVENWHQN